MRRERHEHEREADRDARQRVEGPRGAQLDQLGAERRSLLLLRVRLGLAGELEEDILERARNARSAPTARRASRSPPRRRPRRSDPLTSSAPVGPRCTRSRRRPGPRQRLLVWRADADRRRPRRARRTWSSGPLARSSPFEITTTSSTLCETSESRWLETRTARPWRASERSRSRIQRMPGRVEAVGRLVEDQHLGIAQQRGGDGQPLAHAHRVALDAPVAGVGDPDQLQHLLDARRAGGRRPRRGCAGGCARCGRGGSSRPRAPRRRARSGARGRRSCGRRRCRARVGVDQAEQHPDRRALAGAVGTEEAGDPPGLDLEREVRRPARTRTSCSRRLISIAAIEPGTLTLVAAG